MLNTLVFLVFKLPTVHGRTFNQLGPLCRSLSVVETYEKYKTHYYWRHHQSATTIVRCFNKKDQGYYISILLYSYKCCETITDGHF